MGPLAVGTDGAGSIRIPSTFCGIPGIKPSFGRVPAYPLSPFGTVAHIGPHARSVEDLALMLTVMSRPDARDWTSLPYDPRDYRVGLADGVRGLRIAFSPDLGIREKRRSGSRRCGARMRRNPSPRSARTWTKPPRGLPIPRRSRPSCGSSAR
jgi:Asp-tRNA(Asn)/Glu-tRNA(Gln) amidotransferase A subunit family amidase